MTGLNRRVRVGLTEKLRSEQTLEEGKAIRYVNSRQREQAAKSLMVRGCLGVIGTRQPVLLEWRHQGTKWRERRSKRYCMEVGVEKEGMGILHANPVGPCRLL